MNFNICTRRVSKYLKEKYFEGFRERKIGVSNSWRFSDQAEKRIQ